jgi:hypothetical protein
LNIQRAAGFGFFNISESENIQSQFLEKIKISGGYFKALKEVGVFVNEMVENHWLLDQLFGFSNSLRTMIIY